MLNWIPNSDNTDFHHARNGNHIHCTLSGGVWRIEVWVQDHKKMDVWAGKAMDTALPDVQAFAEQLLDAYVGWKK